MTKYEQELKDTIAEVIKSHPLWADNTGLVIEETARRLIKRREWSAAEAPSTRHAWPAYLSYGGPEGYCSWSRTALGWRIAEARKAAKGNA